MGFKDILVHVDSTAASRGRLKLALLLADCFGGRLIGLHVTPDASVPPYFKPSAIERIARIYTTNAHAAAKRAEALFRNETKRTGAPVVWECISGVMDERIAERARFADLLVIGQFDAENPPSISSFSLPAKVVFDSASPIIVVPNERDTGDIGKHIVAAWDGSPEAARAIRDALPLLRRAKRVMLLAVDPDEQGHIPGGADALQMADHLLRHGVEAIVEEISSGGSNVSEMLSMQAAEFSADLLIMGAYGHSRVLEFIVGGTTVRVLENTKIPVFISR